MRYSDGKNIMVYVETASGAPINAALEVLAKAGKLARDRREEAVAVLIGSGLEEAAKAAIEAGADQAVLVEQEERQAEALTETLCALVDRHRPAIVLMAATQDGKAIAPGLAKRWESGCATDVTGITEDGVYTCLSYNGNVINDLKMGEAMPHIATVRPGSFGKDIIPGKTGCIQREDVEIGADKLRTRIVDTVKEISEAVNLEEAEVIISGGRGMGSKENFQLVEDLAKACGGVVGATRPAIEGEWVSRAHQVGQSGKIVAPKLYIACGISGATQHVSGMIGSNYIVAINKDEDAPIFDVADVGIVGDVMKVLPLMIEEFKRQKEQ